MTARIVSPVFIALFACLPATGHALGLGKLKVHSSLNQPLNAEINFTSLTEAELKGLTVSLASRADFTAAGVERAPFLAQIKFSVNRNTDGRYTLRFSTPTPIDEPFLHLLLQIDWPGGRLVREYTALIDPPYQVAAKAPTVEPPRAAPVITPAPKPEPAAIVPVQPDTASVRPPVTAIETQPYAPSAPADVVLSSDGWPLDPGETPPPKLTTTKTSAKGRIGPAPAWANTASHTTRRGETLWSITKKVRSDPQVSLEQAALAIYQQNREAFYDNNMNNIRAGKILRMPAGEDVEALSKEQARGAFQAQFDAWQEYKLKLAKAKRTVAVDEPAETEDKSAASADKKPTADAATAKKAAPAAKGQRSDELLKIVRSNLQGEKGKDGATADAPAKGGEREQVALAERAETLEESLVSKQIEQKELSEKINQVRSQLKRESRLIELESPSLAPAPKPEAPKAEAPKVEPAKVEPPKVAEPPKAVEPPKADAPKVEALKPETRPQAESPPPAPKKTPPPPPPLAEKSLLDTLFGTVGDLLLPIVLGIVVLASALLGFVYMRRRRKAETDFEESILASQAVTMDNNATTRDAAGHTGATTPESSILSDISQGNLANVHTDEVDPVAEAEVYLAYGRDETAEEILKDAIRKHPQRQELKIKLLEIYFHRKDIKAFETLAEEVYAAVSGKGGKLWEKVEDMGSKLSPVNPMFRGAAPAARGPAGEAKVAPAVAATSAVAPTEAVAPPPAPKPESALDFDLGSAAVTTEIKKEEPSFDLDFDMGDIKPSAPKETAPAPSAAKPTATGSDSGLESFDLGAPADNMVDFDFGKSDAKLSVTAASTDKSVNTGTSAGDDFSLDLGMDAITAEIEAKPTAAEASVAAAPAGESQQQRWDEAATKLDLARAYIDMGDAEGARSILEEVTAEGNPEQKKQAQDLVAQIR